MRYLHEWDGWFWPDKSFAVGALCALLAGLSAPWSLVDLSFLGAGVVTMGLSVLEYRYGVLESRRDTVTEGER